MRQDRGGGERHDGLVTARHAAQHVAHRRLAGDDRFTGQKPLQIVGELARRAVAAVRLLAHRFEHNGVEVAFEPRARE